MSSFDLFCAVDDQHRVALLVELLCEDGSSVALRAAPVAEPSRPCLVAWTRRAAREPWLCALFETAPMLVAVRLDDTPLPGPCARALNMQSWPARSTDRKVEALAQWLLRHQSGPALAPPAALAASGSGAARPAKASRGRRSRGRQSSDRWRSLTVLAFLVAGGYLVWSVAPEPGQRSRGDAAGEAAVILDPREDSAIADADEGLPEAGDLPLVAVSEARDAPARPGHAGPAGAPLATVTSSDPPTLTGAATSTGPVAAADAATSAGGRAASTEPTAATPTRPAMPKSSGGSASDALGHLCNAQSPAAARAWAGALNWKQRSRVTDEPCVEALLERPGFGDLRALLGPA